MQTKSEAGGQGARTFIEEARRAQIVAGAIETIAEVGYGQASLGRIAQQIGISKGVIGYHFEGKDELLAEVVREVLAQAASYIQPRMAEAETGTEWLRTYIEVNLEFMSAYRSQVIAIAEIARNARRDEEPQAGFDFSVLQRAAGALAEILRRFQEKGELRSDFDPVVVGVAIRAAIDAIPPRLARHPEIDAGHYGQELASLFDVATRPAKGRRTRQER